MEELLFFLEKFNEQIDFRTEAALMTDGRIDSVELVTLVSDLEEKFQVEISLDEIIPDNFDSAERIWQMLQRLKK